MKNIANLFDPGRPWLVMLCLIAALVALSGCTTPIAPKEEAPLTVHDTNAARAMALQKIGETATDGETKRLAIFAVMAMGTNQAAPAPAVQGPRSVGEAIFGFLDRTFERALNIAPAYFAYRGQVRSAQTTERVAEINRDVSINQSNNFMGLGIAGIGGTQAVGIAGVNALATVATTPHAPSTVITGNTGPVNAGNGTLTFAPITGSQNPTNPAKICTTNAAGIQTCV